MFPSHGAGTGGPQTFSLPTRPSPARQGHPQTHLKADAHVGRHDDLVALAVHLRAPQELALGGCDVVVSAVVTQLDTLLRDQKHALRHVLVCGLRGVAGEPLRDFLGGQNITGWELGKGTSVHALVGRSKGHSGTLDSRGFGGFAWSSPS